MLPKGNRMAGKKDIERVFREGKPLFCLFLGGKVVFPSGNKGKEVKIAVIASKKYFRRAVERNRAKRLLREAGREVLKKKLFPSGEYAFFYTKRPESLTLEEVSRALLGCLQKIRR